jgi:hypothetical protein
MALDGPDDGSQGKNGLVDGHQVKDAFPPKIMLLFAVLAMTVG